VTTEKRATVAELSCHQAGNQRVWGSDPARHPQATFDPHLTKINKLLDRYFLFGEKYLTFASSQIYRGYLANQ